VLAFRNIGGDSANEPFSEGVSEEIATALGQVPGLQVTARSLAQGYKGSSLGSLDIGKRLHVRYVLDGGVRIGGSQRRINVQLTDVATGIEVWSDEYSRDARDPDVFAVQDAIALAVVASLKIHLSGAAKAALARRSTDNPEAHDLYLKARYFWNQRATGGPVALQRSIGFFKQAIALDSSYALAWAGLADAYSMLPIFGGVSPAEPFARARAAAQRAMTLDSTLADVHTSLGIIAVFHDWDWTTAGREFDKALAIDSTEPHTHLFRAWLFVCQGQFDTALAEMRTAQRLDPLSEVIDARLGSVLVEARRYAEADSVYRQALALASTNVGARAELGLLLAFQHRFPEAFAIFRTLADTTDLNQVGGWLVAAPLGYAYGVAGRRTEALEIQHYLEERARTHYIMPQSLALIAIGLGDTARALDELERGVRERSALIMFLAWPMYDPLRGQPRFQQIVREIGIVLPPIPGGKPN
jgi:TolB-like protein/tetratricopeptide (TPR) repeat protein